MSQRRRKSRPARKEIRLKVAEAKQRDAGYGIARIDKDIGAAIGLLTGDLIEIRGRKSAAATLWLGYAEDKEKGIIRIDGYTRSNAGVSLNDYIIVRKAKAKDAAYIKLAPFNMRMEPDENFVRLIKSRLIDFPVVQRNVVPVHFFGNLFSFVVVQTRPSGIVRITPRTKIVIQGKTVKEKALKTSITYEDIGGLRHEIQRIREMIELPLRHPELFQKVGIDPPRGVMLFGPPGCGKTLLAKAVANEAEANFVLINGPEIMNKYYGETEARLRQVFSKAEQDAPSVIFIDELDAVAPRRSEVTGEVEKRVVAQLLALMDGLEERGAVIVIGATNRLNAVDPALRRPGRFDREIEIGIPDKKSREEVLHIHTRGMPLAEDVDLHRLAEIARGYTGADLSALCREAAMKAIRGILPDIDLSEEKISPEVLGSLEVKMRDFTEAFKEITPTAMREVEIEVPTVHWSDIGGLEEPKQKLIEAVEWPLKHPEKFSEMGVKPPRGILLYGPPGCGKTLLAKAVATESEANFISVKGPEIFSKWVGESEKAIREIFRKARLASPSIVFFDEIDALVLHKEMIGDSSGVSHKVISQLMLEIDGVEELSDVMVIGATNRPNMIDPSMLRPGRLDRLVYVGPPDQEARLQILKIHSKGMPVDEDVSVERLASATEGYSGADLELLCREAALTAMRKNMDIKLVSARDFDEAMKIVKPSITPFMTKEYQRIGEMLRSSDKPLTMVT